MKLQVECRHSLLRFGSGDYYIFCTECPARWVMSDASDIASPGNANLGVLVG